MSESAGENFTHESHTKESGLILPDGDPKVVDFGRGKSAALMTRKQRDQIVVQIVKDQQVEILALKGKLVELSRVATALVLKVGGGILVTKEMMDAVRKEDALAIHPDEGAGTVMLYVVTPEKLAEYQTRVEATEFIAKVVVMADEEGIPPRPYDSAIDGGDEARITKLKSIFPTMPDDPSVCDRCMKPLHKSGICAVCDTGNA